MTTGGYSFSSVTFMIAAHNRSALTLQTLESLAKVTIPNGVRVDCVIVANACTDDTHTVVPERARLMPFATRMVVEERIGVGHARNRLVTEATGDLLVFVDNDVRAETDLLVEHLRVYREHSADLVTGRIELWFEETPDPGWLSPTMRQLLGENRQGDRTHRMSQPSAYGANMSFRRAVLEIAGPFRTDVGRKGTQRMVGEETLFAERAMDAGMSMYYCPSALVHHWVAASGLSDEYLMRSFRQTAMSIVITARRVSPVRYLVTALLGCGRMIVGKCEAGAGRLVNTRNLVRRGRCRWSTGLGQLEGIRRRLSQGAAR